MLKYERRRASKYVKMGTKNWSLQNRQRMQSHWIEKNHDMFREPQEDVPKEPGSSGKQVDVVDGRRVPRCVGEKDQHQ